MMFVEIWSLILSKQSNQQQKSFKPQVVSSFKSSPSLTSFSGGCPLVAALAAPPPLPPPPCMPLFELITSLDLGRIWNDIRSERSREAGAEWGYRGHNLLFEMGQNEVVSRVNDQNVGLFEQKVIQTWIGWLFYQLFDIWEEEREGKAREKGSHQSWCSLLFFLSTRKRINTPNDKSRGVLTRKDSILASDLARFGWWHD